MNFSIKKIVSFIVFVLFISPSLHAETSTASFYKAIEKYNEGGYEEALTLFLSVSDAGINNGKLDYNIGNTYFNLDEKGMAVLFYEKALKIMPDDPDLIFNHNYVVSLLMDKPEEKDFSILDVLFFWNKSLSMKQVQTAAILLNVFFWIMTLYFWKKGIKRGRSIQLILLFMTFLFVTTAGYNYYRDTFFKRGIIVNREVSIRSGFSENSTELFVLHEGTKVFIEKTRENYSRIKFSKGKIGWINNKHIKKI